MWELNYVATSNEVERCLSGNHPWFDELEILYFLLVLVFIFPNFFRFGCGLTQEEKEVRGRAWRVSAGYGCLSVSPDLFLPCLSLSFLLSSVFGPSLSCVHLSYNLPFTLLLPCCYSRFVFSLHFWMRNECSGFPAWRRSNLSSAWRPNTKQLVSTPHFLCDSSLTDYHQTSNPVEAGT